MSLRLMITGFVLLAFGHAGGVAAQSGNAEAGKRLEITQALNRGVPHVTNEILVQFRGSATQGDKARAMRLIVGQKKEVIVSKAKQSGANLAPSDLGDLELVTIPKGLVVSSAMRSIELDPAVVFAEPNWIYQHQATSNDPYVTNSNLWGMTGANGSQAVAAWTNNKTDCGTVYVGIIDEGYFFSHDDLKANAATNPGEIPGNRIDDDNNGYVDDVYGWDFDGNNNTVFDGVGDDHGTHVAGTIGATGNNGLGVAGVCWSVKLMNAKFLGARGGTTANAVRAVDYFNDLKIRHGLNIVATSNSWGGGGYSSALAGAISRANSAEILFIAAAGNSTLNCETSSCYPASYSNANVIAVASITSSGAISSFSNYGSTQIDIGAPGSAINSTVPVKCGKTVCSGYASYSGTSMATPHVSGAAALFKALNPSATAADVKAAILNSATPTASLSGKTVTGGRLNVGGF